MIRKAPEIGNYELKEIRANKDFNIKPKLSKVNMELLVKLPTSIDEGQRMCRVILNA